MQCSGTVMLRNEIGDLFRQPDLFSEARAVSHVTGDDLRALLRTKTVMRIVALLVFDEIIRSSEFADIVIKSPDPGE